LLPGEGLAVELDLPHLMVKDEGQNPSGSWESRGLAVAVARARELGVGRICLRSAGDSARAAAAYASLHGLDVRLQVPDDSPKQLVEELRERGAELQLIAWQELESPTAASPDNGSDGWLDLSAMAEPFRIEGAKTLAFELIYDLGRVPDAIICPTGSGMALASIAKAFDEMQSMGWIGPTRPRLVAVQAASFAPLVSAFRKHQSEAQPWTRTAKTCARELRCNSLGGSILALAALRNSRGTAVAVNEAEIAAGVEAITQRLGLAGSAATGASVGAARQLRQQRFLDRDDLVILISPSSGR